MDGLKNSRVLKMLLILMTLGLAVNLMISLNGNWNLSMAAQNLLNGFLLIISGALCYEQWMSDSSQLLVESKAKGKAIDRAQAVIEFDLNGLILNANDNFLEAMGYSLEEIKGKHHKIFVTEEISNSDDYKDFWKRLSAGEYYSGEFQRVSKNGKPVWIQATYNPIFDSQGDPYKVIKFAADITKQKVLDADYKSQLDAVNRSQAVIEFDLDGIILNANDNFLSVMGYSLDEIKGKHHRLFVDKEMQDSSEYKKFWQTLRHGEYFSGEFRRKSKDGHDVWIQASYNPILDLSGKPYKVVKYASDVTHQKQRNTDIQGQLDAVNRSQAVIEFNLDGTIIHANDNFLSVMGYSLEEIKGRHHRMFVDKETSDSSEYIAFWDRLSKGEFASGEFKRLAKDGSEVWIQASYNPIFDLSGKAYKVVKYASDVTEQRMMNIESQHKIEDSERKIKQHLEQLQRRILQYKEYVSKVSNGDLTVSISLEGDDDLTSLGMSLEEMSNSLTGIAKNILSESASIGSGVAQLEATTNAQAASAAEQAAAVTEISSIVEEIKVTSQQTLSKVSELGQSATKTSQEGERGRQAISNINDSMSELQNKMELIAKTILGLSEKTQQIGDITEAVADIAKQSKMLALNASVEAAKAGESGKGFAVVAGEVKELAEQSQKSTEKVKQILQDIRMTAEKAVMVTEDGTKSVDVNLRQVNSTGELMAALSEVINETALASEQITSAVREESIAIDQVVTSVKEIDKVAHQYSVATEESKKSAIDLTRVANSLKESVSIYKIEG